MGISKWKDWYWNKGGRDSVQFSRKTRPVLLQMEKEYLLMKNVNVYCMGIQCTIKNQCLRFTKGLGLVIEDGTSVKFLRKCTNQRLYTQDENNIVKGR